jgi:hypothetical protein
MARSRATFPALCACRMMNSSLGQPTSTPEVVPYFRAVSALRASSVLSTCFAGSKLVYE